MQYHARDLRKGRYSEISRIYHITVVTRRRLPLLAEINNARLLVSCLRDQQENSVARTIAYVIMPDHIHWLMELLHGDLAGLMRNLKSASGFGIAQRIGRKGPVWQRGYHDHALRAHEDVRAVARYIVANPLRAGLATTIGDYPWWDAVWVGEDFGL